MDVVTKLKEERLLPVAVLDDADAACRLAEALREGGLNLIEVTLRTDNALECIAAVARRFPDMVIGAGTVLDRDQVLAAHDAGASFCVSPGLNKKVVKAARKAGLLLTPGVMTPTEIDYALSLGCTTLKFFPAEPAGGAKMLRALIGPFKHLGVEFIPTGSINAEKLRDYLAIPQVVAVGGSWFVSADLVKAGKFEEITRLTSEALSVA